MKPVVDEVIDPRGEPTNVTFLNKCNIYMCSKCLSLHTQIGISLSPHQRSFFFFTRWTPLQKNTTGQTA